MTQMSKQVYRQPLPTFSMNFKLLLVFITGITYSNANLYASPKSVFLQPGEEISITISANESEPCSVFLHIELPYIASVNPSQPNINLQNASTQIVVKGNQLGYTAMIATVNESTSAFSVIEGLVQITVLQYHWIRTCSIICGWVYFSAWTFSFYPQLLSNMRRKSVVGLNFDFLALNELGYICYSIFNCCFYFLSSIETEYFHRHPGATNPVLLNDVLFSVHGLVVTSVMILQVFLYERGDQSMSYTGIALVSMGGCLLAGALAAALQGYMAWLDAIVLISIVKLIVTTTKYVPQIQLNYRNKSTVGWSIECILCDLMGSCFSLFQMTLISYNCDDWVSIIGDPTKFSLGLVSIGFDMVFILQHYVFYRKKDEKIEKSVTAVESSFLNKIIWIAENESVSK